MECCEICATKTYRLLRSAININKKLMLASKLHKIYGISAGILI